MLKSRLLTPGPTMVPEVILARMGEPMVHHRTPQFKAAFDGCRAGLRWLFQTKEDVLMLTCSGSGAMEAAVVNLLSPGDEVVTLNAGKFGGRWTHIAKAYGITAHEIKVEAGQAITATQVKEKLARHPQTRAVFWQASETSTGVQLPTKEICDVVRDFGALSVVDAITALGVIDLPMDTWGIDALITGSQKALMLPPGLACIALSSRAWDAAAKARLPRFYFNLLKEREAQAGGQTAWTTAVPLVRGLELALQMMQKETLPGLFQRHGRLAEATRAGVKALGLELLAPAAPSTAVTAVKVPAEIKDGKAIPKTMRDRYGVAITGGQDELEGKIFRLTHLGYVDQFDVITGLAALELALSSLGYAKFKLGASTGAALEVFARKV